MKRLKDIHICVNSSDGTHSVERTIPLAEKGFKISFIAHKEFDRADELRNFKNVTIYLLNEINPKKEHFRLTIYTNLIKRLKPDLVIVHFCGYDRYQSAIFSGVKPIIGILMGGEVDTHDCKTPLSTYVEANFTKLFLPYIELLASKTNKIVRIVEGWELKGKVVHIPWGVKISEEFRVQSSELRDKSEEQGVQNSESRVKSKEFKKENYELKVREDEKRKRELRIKFGLPLDKFLVLSNRNVAETGRQMEILKGFHKLVKEGLNVYLLIAARTSTNSYLRKIKEYIKNNDLEDNVDLFEYIPQKEMLKYYSACDVLVSNWVHDGLPQTFFEASLRGLPIIMNDLQQYRDYYEDKVSALINDGNTEGISKCIKILYEDNNLRHSIAENGRKVIEEKANFDKWAEYFIQQLTELIESGKKIVIPQHKIFLGKIIVGLILICRRWPFNKIMVRV